MPLYGPIHGVGGAFQQLVAALARQARQHAAQERFLFRDQHSEPYATSFTSALKSSSPPANHPPQTIPFGSRVLYKIFAKIEWKDIFDKIGRKRSTKNPTTKFNVHSLPTYRSPTCPTAVFEGKWCRLIERERKQEDSDEEIEWKDTSSPQVKWVRPTAKYKIAPLVFARRRLEPPHLLKSRESRQAKFYSPTNPSPFASWCG